MIIRREIELDRPYNEVLNVLGIIDSQDCPASEYGVKKFRIYKSLTSLYDHRMFRFVITGKIENRNTALKVVYIIQPVLPVYIVSLFLIIGLVLCILRSFMSYPKSILIALLINLFFWGNVLFQEKECAQAFEKKLKENTGDGLREPHIPDQRSYVRVATTIWGIIGQ